VSACDETRGMKRGEVCMRAMERRWGRGGGGERCGVGGGLATCSREDLAVGTKSKDGHDSGKWAWAYHGDASGMP